VQGLVVVGEDGALVVAAVGNRNEGESPAEERLLRNGVDRVAILFDVVTSSASTICTAIH
jgi:hypothetical protein